jgi:hypothetical protein
LAGSLLDVWSPKNVATSKGENQVRRLWRDYSLSITAAVLFLITWLVYAVVE